MKSLIVFGVLLAAISIVFAGPADNPSKNPDGYVIPKALEEEGRKLKEKIDALNLPKSADGMYPDICKINDEAIKKMLNDFIEKVNSSGGKIPKPNC